MTPRPLDRDVVTRRLRKIEELVQQLEAIGPMSAEELRTRAVEGLAVERILTLVVDLAVDINGHVMSSVLGRAPEDYADSFAGMAAAGVIGPGTADELHGATGMRNVLVHGYLDVDRGLVSDALPHAPEVFRSYTRQVARWLLGAGEQP